jgi:signal transduction histidine kinase
MGFLVFGLVAAAALYSGHRLLREALLKDLHETVAQTSVILNVAVSPSAAAGNLSALSEFLGELLEDRGMYGLLYMAVGREDGAVLLKAGDVPWPLPAPDVSGDYALAATRGMLNIRQPLLLDHNEIGFLQYGLSTQLMVQASNSVNQQVLWLLIGVTTGGIGFVLVVGYYVNRRLNTLLSASEAIAAGDYSRRVPVRGRDELAQLGLHFNLMAEAVAQRIVEITRLNINLEKRVEERTAELSDLNATLQSTIADLNHARATLVRSEKLAGLGALVAGVAHELNTPIGNALTVASTLQERAANFASEVGTGLRRSALDGFLEAAQTASDLLQRNLSRASNLITSFKHVAVDQTSEQRRSFDLLEVTREVLATLSPILDKTPYRIALDIPPGIFMDSYPGPFGQVVMNLTNNALMHAFIGREIGSVRIEARRSGQDERVSLTFEDDGVGIAADDMARIFDPFFTTRLGRGGSGLGLSIVHNLVYSVLGGTIQVESVVDDGTRFLIELPMSAPESTSSVAG